MNTTLRHSLAAIGLCALAVSGIYTCTQPDPNADADNQCPVGCVETEQSSIITPHFDTQIERAPWIFAVPRKRSSSVTTTAPPRKHRPQSGP